MQAKGLNGKVNRQLCNAMSCSVLRSLWPETVNESSRIIIMAAGSGLELIQCVEDATNEKNKIHILE